MVNVVDDVTTGGSVVDRAAEDGEGFTLPDPKDALAVCSPSMTVFGRQCLTRSLLAAGNHNVSKYTEQNGNHTDEKCYAGTPRKVSRYYSHSLGILT